MRDFHEVLNEYMDEGGVRQRDIVAATGYTAAYISALCSGRQHNPTFARAVAVIDALDVDVDEFAARCMERPSRRESLTRSERALLAAYRSMSDEGRVSADATMAALAFAHPKGAAESSSSAEGAA